MNFKFNLKGVNIQMPEEIGGGAIKIQNMEYEVSDLSIAEMTGFVKTVLREIPNTVKQIKDVIEGNDEVAECEFFSPFDADAAVREAETMGHHPRNIFADDEKTTDIFQAPRGADTDGDIHSDLHASVSSPVFRTKHDIMEFQKGQRYIMKHPGIGIWQKEREVVIENVIKSGIRFSYFNDNNLPASTFFNREVLANADFKPSIDVPTQIAQAVINGLRGLPEKDLDGVVNANR